VEELEMMEERWGKFRDEAERKHIEEVYRREKQINKEIKDGSIERLSRKTNYYILGMTLLITIIAIYLLTL
jgi:hypothetical protein